MKNPTEYTQSVSKTIRISLRRYSVIRYLQRIKDICENGEICHPNLITNHGKGNLLILSFPEIPLQNKIDKDNAQKLRTDNPPIQSQGRRNKYSLL